MNDAIRAAARSRWMADQMTPCIVLVVTPGSQKDFVVLSFYRVCGLIRTFVLCHFGRKRKDRLGIHILTPMVFILPSRVQSGDIIT